MRLPQPGSTPDLLALATSEGRAAWHAAPPDKRVRLLFDHALGLLDLAILDGRDRSIRAAIRFLHECQTQLDRVEAEAPAPVEVVEREAMFEILQERPDVYEDFVRRCERLEATAK